MSPDEIGKEIEKYTYEYLLNKALGEVPEGIDIREGSIIYDAIAPACYRLAEFYMELKNFSLESFVQTASGPYLDLRAEEHGLTRFPASQALATGHFVKEDGSAFTELTEGDRFSSIGDDPIYYQVVTKTDKPGYFTLKAEVKGTRGNQYVGQILPIDNFNGLAKATITEITIPARDEEEDDELRDRILKTYQIVSFGGNVEDYIGMTTSIAGVGAVQVYPIWNGGGTVKVVIVSSSFDLPSEQLLNEVQKELDPTPQQKGYGLAPIGHKVSVVSPSKRTVDIAMKVDSTVETTVEALKPLIKKKMEEFFLNTRKVWSKHDDLYQYKQIIYRSQLSAQILSVEGVANVANITFNGKEEDLTLEFNNDVSELPFLGEVSYQ